MRNSCFSFIMLYFQKKKFPEPVRIIMFFFRDKLKNKISTLDNQARKSWKQNFMIDGRQGVLSSQVTKLTKENSRKKRLVMNLPESLSPKDLQGLKRHFYPQSATGGRFVLGILQNPTTKKEPHFRFGFVGSIFYYYLSLKLLSYRQIILNF